MNAIFPTQKRSTRQTMKPKKVTPASKARDRIIRRAALEFKDGMYGKYKKVLRIKFT